ncbi:MAG: MFS transporter [Chloroflexota bacterium]
MSAFSPRPNRLHRIVEYSILIIILSVGIRQSFGIFLVPIVEDLDIDRSTFSLAVAIQQLIFGFPLVGILADRYGSRIIAISGGLLYSASIFWVALFASPFTLFVSFGVLIGIALSATTYVVVLGAVAQVVSPERRSFSFGLITAAGSFGMFAVVYGLGQLRNLLGWRPTFIFMGFMVLIVALIATQFPGRRADADEGDMGDVERETLLPILRKAGRNRSYWLLFAGFFTCGFHVAFVSTHLPAYLLDRGLSSSIGDFALAMIGLFNIFGSSFAGWLGDRYPKKYLLSGIYLARAIVFAGFIFLPLSNLSAVVFGALFGFIYLATVPLTSGAIAQIFGSRYLSTLYGFVFFGHQIGAFLGVWLGGLFFDQQGSYMPVWIMGIALGVAAFFVHLPISTKPVVVSAVGRLGDG